MIHANGLAMAYQPAQEPPQHRERLLLPSASGRFYVVVEVHWRRQEPDLDVDLPDLYELTPDEYEECCWIGECFEVSGWLNGRGRAGMRRAQLEREGRWLSEESKLAMRNGAVLRVSALQWEPAPASPAMRRD